MNDWLTSLKCGNYFAFKSYLCIYPIWSKSKTVHPRAQKKIPVLKPAGVWRVNWTRWFSCWHREQHAAFLARWSAEIFLGLVWFSLAPQKGSFYAKEEKTKLGYFVWMLGLLECLTWSFSPVQPAAPSLSVRLPPPAFLGVPDLNVTCTFFHLSALPTRWRGADWQAASHGSCSSTQGAYLPTQLPQQAAMDKCRQRQPAGLTRQRLAPRNWSYLSPG